MRGDIFKSIPNQLISSWNIIANRFLHGTEKVYTINAKLESDWERRCHERMKQKRIKKPAVDRDSKEVSHIETSVVLRDANIKGIY